MSQARRIPAKTMITALALAAAAIPAQAAPSVESTPIYIKLEVEDFSGFGKYKGPEAETWKPRMAWYPQWSRGGDSGWWAAAGDAKGTDAVITQQAFIPQDGDYTLWMRYEDYTGQAEPFDVIVGHAGGESKAEFGRADVVTVAHPEIPWNYAWDKRVVKLKKGPATIRISLAGAATVRRALDSLVLTTDAGWTPHGRAFPPQAYANYLSRWAQKREPLKPLVSAPALTTVPAAWKLPVTAGRDFWFTGSETLLPGYPFPVNLQADSRAGFVNAHGAEPGKAPIFSAPAMTLKIPIAALPGLLKPENELRQYILQHKKPFFIKGNYGTAGKIAGSYQQMKELFGPLWLGIVSGENSYLYPPLYAPEGGAQDIKAANYEWLLGPGRKVWSERLGADWNSPVENPYEKWIMGLSVGTVPHIHQLAEAGAEVVGAESAGAMPYIQWQMAFARGAARQYDKRWMWYFGASFGDAIRTFSKESPYTLKLEGMQIDNRNAVIGSSLAHVRRTMLHSYLQGSSFFFPEQGYNLFDTQGQLNPMGWSFDEMLRLATRHPNRGVINTPVAVLLDKAHGWDKYTYNGMKLWDKHPLARPDRMIDQFFNVAYYPFPKNEGEPVNDLNVPWPNGYFGDSFDVLVTSPTRLDAVAAYPVVFCVGDTRLDAKWAARLKQYVSDGGTLVINAEQVVAGMDTAFLGAVLGKGTREASGVVCARDNETLAGTTFPYREVKATTGQVIARTAGGDPVAIRNVIGKGQVILTTPSYLLGHDEIATPYLAHLMLELTSGLQPVEVRGNCQHFVNLRPDGYVVTLSNNEGIDKPSHSAATMDMGKTVDIDLRIKSKPLATEDWIGEDPRPWSFPNEWLPEYTQPRKLTWVPDGDGFKSTVRLLPGEIRVYFVKTK